MKTTLIHKEQLSQIIAGAVSRTSGVSGAAPKVPRGSTVINKTPAVTVYKTPSGGTIVVPTAVKHPAR